ncbi:MAG: Preflagellin peptidase [Candidatus Heimdallarchaeota archaeon LC_2]|nr:MAG: Preflagellin peptidase [Candidatus Heimdallarchaeota archaeon LC_2]
MIHLFWLLLTLVILVWATYEDLKYRMIQDKIWAIFIIFALPSYIFWVNTIATSDERIISIINIIFSIIITFVLFIGGSFAGGDGKALILLSLTTPITTWDPDILYLNQSPLLSVFFILLLFLAYTLLFALSLLIRNLFEIKKFGKLFGMTEGSVFAKINVLLSSRRVEFSHIVHIKHSDPAEIYDLGGWKLFAPIFQGAIEDEEAIKIEIEMREKALNDAKNTNREYLWFRPQPPGLFILTLAYLTWIIIGGPYSILS